MPIMFFVEVAAYTAWYFAAAYGLCWGGYCN